MRDRWLSKVPTQLVALVSEKIERNSNTDRQRLRCANKNAAFAHIGSVALGKVIYRRALELDLDVDWCAHGLRLMSI